MKRQGTVSPSPRRPGLSSPEPSVQWPSDWDPQVKKCLQASQNCQMGSFVSNDTFSLVFAKEDQASRAEICEAGERKKGLKGTVVPLFDELTPKKVSLPTTQLMPNLKGDGSEYERCPNSFSI